MPLPPGVLNFQGSEAPPQQAAEDATYNSASFSTLKVVSGNYN